MKNLALSHAEITAFINNWSSYLPRDVTSSPAFSKAVESVLNRRDELASVDICLKRIQGMGLRVDPASLAEKVFKTPKGPVIAGIRYRGLDPDFPFIDFLPTFRVQTHHDLDLLRELALNVPEVLPKGFTFHESSDQFPELQRWKCYLWGQTDIKPVCELPVFLRFVPEMDDVFYKNYHDEYSKWQISHPDLRGFVRIEEKEELLDAVKANLLFSIYDESGWAGLVAGANSDFMGTPAVYIFELFLAHRLRGRHIAVTLQSCFLQSAKDRYKWVWGHIHGTNHASLKTAQRIGRRMIQAEYFVPIR